MKKIIKVGLLFLIAVVQVLTIVGGFIGSRQMSEMLWKSVLAYKELVEEKYEGLIIDYGLIPNPFSPLFPLVLLGLFLTVVLLIDEIRHKNAENPKPKLDQSFYI